MKPCVHGGKEQKYFLARTKKPSIVILISNCCQCPTMETIQKKNRDKRYFRVSQRKNAVKGIIVWHFRVDRPFNTAHNASFSPKFCLGDLTMAKTIVIRQFKRLVSLIRFACLIIYINRDFVWKGCFNRACFGGDIVWLGSTLHLADFFMVSGSHIEWIAHGDPPL